MTESYIPVKTRREVLARDGFRCVWCGEKEEHDLSHFIQKQAGGKTLEYNLVTTCKLCKRKRHYDNLFEFISKLKLEELDIFKDITMRVKIIFKKGEEEIGFVEKLPSWNDKGFYFCHEGNGTREPILMSEVHRIIELGGREKK